MEFLQKNKYVFLAVALGLLTPFLFTVGFVNRLFSQIAALACASGAIYMISYRKPKYFSGVFFVCLVAGYIAAIFLKPFFT